MGYTSAQKKEMAKLSTKYETRFPNTCDARAKAEVDRKIREQAARDKKNSK